jgi:predicted esterase
MPADVRWIETPTHGRLLVRAAVDGAAPRVIVGFHGYAETAAIQMARLEAIPGSRRWTLVSVQALHLFYRGRSDEVVASWMTRADRERAIEDNVRYVNAAVASVIGDAVRPTIVYAGFSQGGAMAYRAGVLGAFPAAAVIVVGADTPPELAATPHRFPPVLIVRGERDEWYTAAKQDADGVALRAAGAEVRTAVVDAGHEWDEQVGRVVGEFLPA